MAHFSLRAKARLEYFFDRPRYKVARGGTVAVTLFLRETYNHRDGASWLAPGTDGLVHGGVLIEAGTTPSSCPARVKSTPHITGNPAFDFAIIPQLVTYPSASRAGILELSDKPVFGEVVSRDANCETVQMLLGTFVFTAGRLAGEMTFLTATVNDFSVEYPGDNNVTNSGVVLDPLIRPGRAMITVSPGFAWPHFAKDLSGLAETLGALTRGNGYRKS